MSEQQPTLWDSLTAEPTPAKPKAPRKPRPKQVTPIATKTTASKPKPVEPDWEALENIAFLYTTGAMSKRNGTKTIRFAMTTKDAQTFCSSDLSKGSLYGNEWMYVYTTAKAYLYSADTRVVDISKCIDNNGYDSVIEELGCTKIPLEKFKETLEPLGIQVKDTVRKLQYDENDITMTVLENKWHAGEVMYQHDKLDENDEIARYGEYEFSPTEKYKKEHRVQR
jgi:hypothetical protein